MPLPNYQRYCRWHDPRLPLDGPLCPYLGKEKIMLCPAFNDLAVRYAPTHPAHDANCPIDPQYSYSMNSFLGSSSQSVTGRISTARQITRSNAEVFLFAEESMWGRPGCTSVLNDTALSSYHGDWFGTFHNAPADDLNGGTVNAVFVDGHVQAVRSALGKDPNDKSQMEKGSYEKYSWPLQLSTGQ
jgi:prepilin-type processing-associated H-X9-DG protein